MKFQALQILNNRKTGIHRTWAESRLLLVIWYGWVSSRPCSDQALHLETKSNQEAVNFGFIVIKLLGIFIFNILLIVIFLFIKQCLMARNLHLRSYSYLYNGFFIICFLFLHDIAYLVQSCPPYLPVSWSDTVLVRALLTTMLDEASPTTRGAITTQSWNTSVTKAYRKQVAQGVVN